jgi:hypothetical protein
VSGGAALRGVFGEQSEEFGGNQKAFSTFFSRRFAELRPK